MKCQQKWTLIVKFQTVSIDCRAKPPIQLNLEHFAAPNHCHLLLGLTGGRFQQYRG